MRFANIILVITTNALADIYRVLSVGIMQIDFETLLLKTGFKVTKLQRCDKLHIAIDFEENKGNFKGLLQYSSEVWFEDFRYELTKYKKTKIGNKIFWWW